MLLEDPDPLIYERRGDANAELGRWKEASRDYVESGEHGVDDLALVYSKLGDRSEGRRNAEMWVSAAINDETLRGPAIYFAAFVPDWLDDYSVLIEFAEGIRRNQPGSIEPMLDLAALYYRAGRLSDAVDLLKEPELRSFLDLKEQRKASYPSPLYLAAIISAANGDGTRAQEYIETALAAEKSIKNGKNYDWSFFCACDLLREEAEALIKEHATESASAAAAE
jgi:hypothetical protein